MGKICGTGDMCENTCPVMSMGRICPDLPTFLNEVRKKFGINCGEEAAEREPVPA
jgi:hypothetical protein